MADEQRGLFEFRPPAGPVRRPSRSRSRPYSAGNNTWTRSFNCLASTDRTSSPSISERMCLSAAGLGECRITFNKDGNSTHVHEKILETFPALERSGGYEFFRSSDRNTRQLIQIPMTSGGYTVPYLKSVLGQGRVYIRPLQNNIPLTVTQNLQDDNSPEVNCINCNATMRMSMIREHRITCNGGPSNLQSSTSPQSSDTIEQYLNVPSLSTPRSSVSASVDSDSDSDPITELQALFPHIPLNEIEHALQTESGCVNGAAETLLQRNGVDMTDDSDDSDDQQLDQVLATTVWDETDDVETTMGSQLSDILERLRLKLDGPPRRILLEQDDVLADVIAIYKDPMFDATRPLRVTFKNQPAVDVGGPRKEMYSLAYESLVNSTDYRLFEGPDGRLTPFYNAAAVFSGLMKTLGTMLAHSIVQCGMGLPVFAPVCYWYLITGDVSRALPYANLTDIRDTNVAMLTEKIIQANTRAEMTAMNNDENFHTLLSEIGCTSNITVANRSAIVESILMHFILNKKKVLLDQLREGLKTLGVLEEAIQSPLKFEMLFVKTDTELNSDRVKVILKFPEIMDEDEINMEEMLLKFLDECPCSGLQDFLRFTTGAGTLPMAGSFINRIQVSFDAVEGCIFASTCFLTLQLPSKVDTYELFRDSLNAAITGHSFNVV